MTPTALYVHIPFCDHKCIYCDFYSIITQKNLNEFLDALKKEISYYSDLYSQDRKLISIYFGGGTPSLIDVRNIDEIISYMNKYYHFADNIEITLETNPGTVDKIKLREFRKIGVNRLSIGIQSFDDKDLQFLTRIHDESTAVSTVNDAAIAGFENINIDLIFNLPGQTIEKWNTNLERAVSLPVKHISAYSLILERGTILNKMVLDGKVKISESDYDAALYENTIDFLTARGFDQYEVSNFAKPGFECRHNNAYWRYQDYFGFGPSAHSFAAGKRWWNFSALNFYLNSVNQNGNAKIGEEVLSGEQRINEFVMLSLRSSGLDLNKLKREFDHDWYSMKKDMIKKLIKEEFVTESNNFIKFTKKGYALCDEILAKLI